MIRRENRGRFFLSKRALPIIVGAGLAMGASVVGATAASASTLGGSASITDPTTGKVLASGASTKTFTITLPASAACTGDTASSGYHVFSYLVPKGKSIKATTFKLGFPSVGLGFFDSIGNYVGPLNTAATTGQIIGIPLNLNWAAALSTNTITPSQLVPGTTTATWEGGIACANSNGVLSDYWNLQIVFKKTASDPNGITWTASSKPAPAIKAISPAAGSVAGGTLVTITGTALTGTSQVKFGTVKGTSIKVVSATKITVISPAHAKGKVDVTLNTPAGPSPKVAGDKFTYS